MGPLLGDTVVITGLRLTEKVRVAGVGSSFPARSRAFTENVWLVSASPANVTLVSETNALQAPLSRRYEKTRFPTAVRLSEPLNVKVAVVTGISPLGPSMISVSGGVLSTVTTSGALARLPTASAPVA